MNYRIKQLCKEKGITINELAEKSKLKRESVSRIINGADTTTQTLNSIAEILGVPVSELLAEPSGDFFKCPHCGGTIKMSKE